MHPLWSVLAFTIPTVGQADCGVLRLVNDEVAEGESCTEKVLAIWVTKKSLVLQVVVGPVCGAVTLTIDTANRFSDTPVVPMSANDKFNGELTPGLNFTNDVALIRTLEVSEIYSMLLPEISGVVTGLGADAEPVGAALGVAVLWELISTTATRARTVTPITVATIGAERKKPPIRLFCFSPCASGISDTVDPLRFGELSLWRVHCVQEWLEGTTGGVVKGLVGGLWQVKLQSLR